MLIINPDNPQPRLIAQAIEQLRRGAVICYPTDTVYGIGCDIFNQKAVKRVYRIKQRSTKKPFSFMCSSLKDVSTYCHLSNIAYRLMRKNLPGAYTFILPTMKIVPKIMTSKQKTVGIRVPDNNICRALVESLGNPILTTSATLDAETIPAAEAYEFAERLMGQVDLFIDGGPVYPEPSSIISLTGTVPEVLREGKGEVRNLF
ncbi:MAG: threonylcarbamoyl-AMP synthase [Deltaproteobacteria bacterium]|nr:threonylcarbamoyl-AMP synthase [Deltaproteobacteria bacterium]